jgi:hypothetical protein
MGRLLLAFLIAPVASAADPAPSTTLPYRAAGRVVGPAWDYLSGEPIPEAFGPGSDVQVFRASSEWVVITVKLSGDIETIPSNCSSEVDQFYDNLTLGVQVSKFAGDGTLLLGGWGASMTAGTGPNYVCGSASPTDPSDRREVFTVEPGALYQISWDACNYMNDGCPQESYVFDYSVSVEPLVTICPACPEPPARPAAPPVLLAGDLNGDGAEDLADVIFHLQYLFAGGPAPPAAEVYSREAADAAGCWLEAQ